MKYLRILYHSAREWVIKDMGYYAAAFSYYAPLALIPLVLLSVAVSGLFYGELFVRNIFFSWGTVLGDDLLALIEVAVINLDLETRSYQIPLIGTILFSGVSILSFNMIATGFRRVWGVARSGLREWLKQSVRSVVFVLFLQLYLIFIIGAEGLFTYFKVPDFSLLPDLIWFLVTGIIFALMYRYLLATSPSRRGCWFGGAVAAALFVMAKNLVVIYVTTKPVLTLFGAAGLILVLLVWVYVLAAITFYGAIAARLYDRMRGINNNLP